MDDRQPAFTPNQPGVATALPEEAERLRSLARLIGKAAAELDDNLASLSRHGSETLQFKSRGELAAHVQRAYNERRRRDRLFSPALFADPAWDMLMDLFIQELSDRAVSIHALCIAAAVPTTTALRWIGKLEAAGLVERSPSPSDTRVVHISLSATGRDAMFRYFGTIDDQAQS